MKKILLIISLWLAMSGVVIAESGELEREYVKGVVLNIEEETSELDFIDKIQVVTIEVLDGQYKGDVIVTENVLSNSYVMDIEVVVGQKVLLAEETYDGETQFHIISQVRDSYILGLLIVFALMLLIVGRFQGLKTIFTLGVTVFFIFMIEIPLLIKGYNALVVTVIVAIFITIITVTIISGLTKKSLASILGTVTGVVLAGGLSIFVSQKVHLTGLTSEEAIMLMNVEGVTFNFQHLLFSAILLGALGAIMDVSMSIASSIDELHNVNKELTMKALFDSGMRVGRDIMGTMSNTLILAYTGSMLPLLLLFRANSDSMVRLVNLDIIATEVIRSVAGSIGLVLTIPVTAVISVMLIKDKRFNK